LRLRVAVADNAARRAASLVVLTGGPGQGGVRFVRACARALRAALGQYAWSCSTSADRDDGALRCPALQRAWAPRTSRLRRHGLGRGVRAQLGPQRAFYSTADTVADLDAAAAAWAAAS
jgi:hypothetical protein